MNPYFSASQILLFIGNHHLDDACAIEYQVSEQKVPVYGYFDTEYARVLKGRRVVFGQLEILFRWWGYLHYAIVQSATTDSLLDISSAAEGTIRDIADTLPATLKDLLLSGNESAIADFAVSRFMTAIAPSSTEEERTLGRGYLNALKTGPRSSDTLPKTPLEQPGFNIVVRFGNVSGMGDPNTTLMLEDVHLTGQSTVIRSDVPDNGTPIRESYPFIARAIRPYKGQRS